MATPFRPGPDRSTASPPPCQGWPATRAPPCARSAPPTSPSSRSSATWWAADEQDHPAAAIQPGPAAGRAPADRGRPAGGPAAGAAGGVRGRADVDPATFTLDLFRQLVLPVLLPVVALTFSTSSLGSELRDGTVTNLLLKPIP